MKLLILGGTAFLGRHIAEIALERGYDLTLFTRGVTNPDLFPEAERLRGDRDGGLGVLEGRSFDAVVDTSGYVPRVVRASAELLAGTVGRYAFVSSISVYADFNTQNIAEDAPLDTIEDETTEDYISAAYGPLKALCEKTVTEVFGNRALCVRPGLIVGPYDRSDRFGYWMRRFDRGGEVLVPDCPDRQVQFIDARDLAAWILDMLEADRDGVYNATGPAGKLTFGEFFAACADVLGHDVTTTAASEAFLAEQGVNPWTDLPIWVPEDAAGMLSTDCTKAQDAGFMYRPLADTLRDALAWEKSRPADTEYRNGISAEREAEVLRAWHEAGEAG